MAECSTDLTLFPLSHKPVVVRANGGALTSDPGALLLRRLDERLGLTRRLAGCLVDRREQGKVRHDVLALLRQRIYQIALGYEDCNDADRLRFDPALKLAVGRAPADPDLASQPTLSRLENQVGWHECWRISEALLACYRQRHRKRPPRRLVLDVDATDDETHGDQQLAFFHGYCQSAFGTDPLSASETDPPQFGRIGSPWSLDAPSWPSSLRFQWVKVRRRFPLWVGHSCTPANSSDRESAPAAESPSCPRLPAGRES